MLVYVRICITRILRFDEQKRKNNAVYYKQFHLSYCNTFLGYSHFRRKVLLEVESLEETAERNSFEQPRIYHLKFKLLADWWGSRGVSWAALLFFMVYLLIAWWTGFLFTFIACKCNNCSFLYNIYITNKGKAFNATQISTLNFTHIFS